MMTMFKGSNGGELGWQLVLFLGVNFVSVLLQTRAFFQMEMEELPEC